MFFVRGSEEKYISFHREDTGNNSTVLTKAGSGYLKNDLYCTFQRQRGSRTLAQSVVLPVNANFKKSFRMFVKMQLKLLLRHF